MATFEAGAMAAGMLGSAAINTGANLGMTALARRENYRYGEWAAKHADERTRALYNDLYSPAAQIAQLKEAGLSPSLFYSDAGGIAGQTGAQGTGAAGLNNQFYGIDPVAMSQIEVNKAQADKLNADANQVRETTAPTVAKIWADAGAAKASATYSNAKTAGQELANYIANATKDFSIYKASAEADREQSEAWKAFSEAGSAQLEWLFNAETYRNRVESIAANKAVLLAEAGFLQAKKELTEQEKEESVARIQKMISDTFQGWAQVDAQQQNADAYKTWVEGKLPYIEKELELEAKRLGIDKTRMWLQFGGDVIKGAGAVVGAGMLKGKGTTGSNPTFLDKGAPSRTKWTQTERHLQFEKYKEMYDY